MDDDNTDKLLTLPEVTERLKIHYNTLCRYIHNGMLPVVLVTRNKRFIREQDLEDFIKKHTGVYKQ